MSDPREPILFVVAHPDDVAFAAGGTATLLSKRYALHVLCVTRGERGYPPGKSPALVQGKVPPSAEIAAIRSAEEEAACAILGAELTFLHGHDGDIFADRELCSEIAEHVTRIKPKALFTHGPFEKADHNAVYAASTKALYMASRYWDCDLLCFYQPEETHNRSMSPIHVDISHVIAEKRRLVECHKSHMHASDTADKLLARNKELGSFCFCEYAEAFLPAIPYASRRWGRPAECGRFLLDL
jgi:LmbE family N-acetylglucosaminyl deacetylase